MTQTFEEWLKIQDEFYPYYEKESDGSYRNEATHAAHIAWQAAQASQREEVEQLHALVGKLVGALERIRNYNNADLNGLLHPMNNDVRLVSINRADEALTEAQKVIGSRD